MDQWEYEVTNCLHILEKPVELKQMLNTYGLQGWELAAIKFHYLVFKRLIPKAVVSKPR